MVGHEGREKKERKKPTGGRVANKKDEQPGLPSLSGDNPEELL